MICTFFFFNDTATTEIYTLSLHDALPIFGKRWVHMVSAYDREHGISYWTKNYRTSIEAADGEALSRQYPYYDPIDTRSEEHTSELQSRQYLVCRLLLEKKKNHTTDNITSV